MLGKKKREPQPTPPWLTWGVIVFIMLALLLNAFGIKTPIPTQGPVGPQGNLTWNVPSIDTYKSRLIPGYGRLQIGEVKKSDGAQAHCGQEVLIRWRQTEAKAGQVTTEELKPKDMEERRFRLSDTAIPEALRASVLGMQVGAIRTVLVPVERVGGGVGVPMRYLIELLEVNPLLTGTIPKKGMGLRVFEVNPGNMQEISCGSQVKAHLAIWDMAGNLLLNTRDERGPLQMKIGEANLPVGIEMGIIGMSGDGSRTLLVPPYLQQTLNPHAGYGPHLKDSPVQKPGVLDSLALPENQTILVDVELVP